MLEVSCIGRRTSCCSWFCPLSLAPILTDDPQLHRCLSPQLLVALSVPNLGPQSSGTQLGDAYKIVLFQRMPDDDTHCIKAILRLVCASRFRQRFSSSLRSTGCQISRRKPNKQIILSEESRNSTTCGIPGSYLEG
jgi:hypothetical protein